MKQSPESQLGGRRVLQAEKAKRPHPQSRRRLLDGFRPLLSRFSWFFGRFPAGAFLNWRTCASWAITPPSLDLAVGLDGSGGASTGDPTKRKRDQSRRSTANIGAI
jgi:hypothetical protein